MKIAPILEALQNAKQEGWPIEYRLIHTGQHYDKKMSGDFFSQLGIPEPEMNLEAGGGTQAEQTAAILTRYEKVLFERRPDLLIVVGDVTSTMACTLAAKKVGDIKVAHVEAGIRSHDLSMPEEINRIVTDVLTDYFFTTSETANENLRKAGVPDDRIFFVGNTMIDTLLKNKPCFEAPPVWEELNLKPGEYFVMTLHRPGNVDKEQNLERLLSAIVSASRGLPLLFPVHPRTAKMLHQIGVEAPNLHLMEPLGYLQFNYLVQHAKAVVTDSGGVTEETTVMHVPCMTLRAASDRPETCTVGTNRVVGIAVETIAPAFEALFNGQWTKGEIPQKWDGSAAPRIVEALVSLFGLKKKESYTHAG